MSPGQQVRNKEPLLQAAAAGGEDSWGLLDREPNLKAGVDLARVQHHSGRCDRVWQKTLGRKQYVGRNQEHARKSGCSAELEIRLSGARGGGQ